MRKWRLFFGDIEKQENWINGIQLEGYQLREAGKYFPVYHFAESPVEPAPIRVDFINHQSRGEFSNYLALFEDSGWQHLSGSRLSGFQYFRRLDSEGEDDIFSDQDSKKIRKRRYFNYSLTYGSLFLVYLLAIWGNPNNQDIWVFRVGIWQKNNIIVDFIIAFLLLFYLLPSLLLLVSALYYLITSIKLSKEL